MSGARADIVGKFPALTSDSAGRSTAIGRIFAENIYPGLLILLFGDLGAGKTLLTQAVGASLGFSRVKSPTFATLAVHKPEGRNFSFVHADLYRLDEVGPDSETAMQLEEYLDDGAVLMVEWGERWRNPPILDRWDVYISHISPDVRSLACAAYGERALANLAPAYERMLELCRTRR